jgi:hypothetical protein
VSSRGQRLGSGKLIYPAFGSSTAHPTRTGCRTSWMSSLGHCLSWERRVSRCERAKADLVVTDMLIAILNCCTKEELEEEEETPMITPETPEIEGMLSECDSLAVLMHRSYRESATEAAHQVEDPCCWADVARLCALTVSSIELRDLDQADQAERSPRRSPSSRASLERMARRVSSLRAGQKRSRMRSTGSMMRTSNRLFGGSAQADL